MDSGGPDLLALHSCMVCHEIFTTESDLLDHTILLHTSTAESSKEHTQNAILPLIGNEKVGDKIIEGNIFFISIILVSDQLVFFLKLFLDLL